MPADSLDRWSDGATYEAFMGRWSRLVAHDFVRWLAIGAGARWLDVGSGTGALSATILATAEPASVRGVEPSAEYVAHARDRVNDVRARFDVGDAMALPFDEGSFDVVVSALVLNFVPEPAVAASEMTRVTRTGGVVAAYVWDYAGEMQLLRHFWDAVVALDPAAASLDQGARFPMCRPEPLGRLFEDAGLNDVETREIDVKTRFRDFDDLWTPFLGGQGPASGYVASLDDDARTALREQLRAGVPVQDDGSIELVARAWAVRGSP